MAAPAGKSHLGFTRATSAPTPGKSALPTAFFRAFNSTNWPRDVRWGRRMGKEELNASSHQHPSPRATVTPAALEKLGIGSDHVPNRACSPPKISPAAPAPFQGSPAACSVPLVAGWMRWLCPTKMSTGKERALIPAPSS